MYEHTTEKRGYVRSVSDGLIHLLSFTNLYSGKNSLGNRIMNWTMPHEGAVDHPNCFAAGFFAGIALEMGALIYLSRMSEMPWYVDCSAYIAAKAIPRGLDFLVKNVIKNLQR